ncbi:hypothetical protein QOT17_005933 [Balamuthia mandrillaris]
MANPSDPHGSTFRNALRAESMKKEQEKLEKWRNKKAEKERKEREEVNRNIEKRRQQQLEREQQELFAKFQTSVVDRTGMPMTQAEVEKYKEQMRQEYEKQKEENEKILRRKLREQAVVGSPPSEKRPTKSNTMKAKNKTWGRKTKFQLSSSDGTAQIDAVKSSSQTTEEQLEKLRSLLLIKNEEIADLQQKVRELKNKTIGSNNAAPENVWGTPAEFEVANLKWQLEEAQKHVRSLTQELETERSRGSMSTSSGLTSFPISCRSPATSPASTSPFASPSSSLTSSFNSEEDASLVVAEMRRKMETQEAKCKLLVEKSKSVIAQIRSKDEELEQQRREMNRLRALLSRHGIPY